MPAVSTKSSRKTKNPYIKWVNSPQGRKALLQRKPELKNNVPALGKELGRIWRSKQQRKSTKSTKSTRSTGGKSKTRRRSKK